MPRIEFDEAAYMGIVDSRLAEEERLDPGAFGPYDVCRDCYEKFMLTSDIVHPTYDDFFEEYSCLWCGTELTETDD